MSRDNDNSTRDLHALRKKAESLLAPLTEHATLSPEQTSKVLQELHTHQIELELQNDDLRQAQVTLLKTQKKYTDLYDFAPVGYFTISDKGLIVEANLTAAELLGIERRSLIKKPFSSFFSPDGQDSHYLCRKRLLETKEPQTCERRMQKQDGHEFEARCKCVIRHDVDGDSGQFRTVITDISRQKTAERKKTELESQIHQAHKMQAVGTLAGGIAHEFNNLLGVIVGSTDMVRDEAPKDSFARVQLDRVMKASYRARDLVKQILTFSRKSHQQRIITLLQPLVKDSLKLIESSLPSSVEVKLDISPGLSKVFADPTEIQQIVMNVCSNAVSAMKEKGILKIGLKQVHLVEPNDGIIGLPFGEYALLSFVDTGAGMDQETLAKICDPFFTTKAIGQGTGLGMSIVYGIMESYGGKIMVESEIGSGTTFRFYFPVTDEPATEMIVEKDEDIRGCKRILFVDDEEMYAEVGEELLSRLGYDVDLKINSMDALKAFKSAPDSYDLVITDQIMPNVSGEELVKEIRLVRPEMPIILCTGYSTQMDEEKAKSLGINAFAFKPIVKKDIAKLIRKVLDV